MSKRGEIVCPECEGLGEWDEGPINCGGPAPVSPEYRQVKCPICDGTGKRQYAFPPSYIDALRIFMDEHPEPKF